MDSPIGLVITLIVTFQSILGFNSSRQLDSGRRDDDTMSSSGLKVTCKTSNEEVTLIPLVMPEAETCHFRSRFACGFGGAERLPLKFRLSLYLHHRQADNFSLNPSAYTIRASHSIVAWD